MDKIKYVALCDSEQCAFKTMKTGVCKKNGKTYDRVEPKHFGPQVKQVHKDTMDCPDCGSVLFWTREEIMLNERIKVG